MISPRRNQSRDASSLIKSKQRIADHGEVFTPDWLIENMLDLVKGESERIDSRFLEPACGSGNFLIKVLARKLSTVEARYSKSTFEKRNYALLALMCIYGIELLPDNIVDCRRNMIEIFDRFLGLSPGDDVHRAGSYVLSQNIVHGDAITYLEPNGMPISFPEWGYLGRGRFQRRDFRFETLTRMSERNEGDEEFHDLGKHEVFKPIRSYPVMTVSELSA